MIVSLFLYRKPILKRIDKLNQLAKNFKNRNPSETWLFSYLKSLYLVLKCGLFDLYHVMTSFRTDKFTFIKYIQGGNICISIVKNKSGPKKNLEYGYINEIRMDEFILMMSGPNRDFYGCKEALLEFGNIIRYKFDQDDEVILNQYEGSENKKKENYKKIKKLVWIS